MSRYLRDPVGGITLLVKLIIFLKVVLFVGLGILVYIHLPDIADFFSGALARFDFALGYES